MVSQPLGLSAQFVAPRCSKLELNNSTKKPDAKVRLDSGFLWLLEVFFETFVPVFEKGLD